MRIQLSIILALSVAGCSGGTFAPSGRAPAASLSQSHFKNGRFIPVWSEHASLIPVELRPGGLVATIREIAARPDRSKNKNGIYAGEFNATSVLGYANPNPKNKPPICSISGVSEINDIAVDPKGTLIVPDGASRTVTVYLGPGLCGGYDGSVTDPYGQPADAASSDAQFGTIVVGNIFDNSEAAGSITLCNTVYGYGCYSNLTNSAMYEVGGVALDSTGDCWASASDLSGTATLTYFQGCSGGGEQATGFDNAYYGGLDIDTEGNLVSISTFDSKLYVYRGCNPACTLVGGPFSLQGEAVFGHLDKKSKHFVTGDLELGQLDIYKYSPTSLTYEYSINNGLNVNDTVEGAAFSPSSKE